MDFKQATNTQLLTIIFYEQCPELYKALAQDMLIGFNTTEAEDMARVECLRELGCEIYPMLYRVFTCYSEDVKHVLI